MSPAVLHAVYFDLSSSAAGFSAALFHYLGPCGSSLSCLFSHLHLQCESLVTIKWLQILTLHELLMCEKDRFLFLHSQFIELEM